MNAEDRFISSKYEALNPKSRLKVEDPRDTGQILNSTPSFKSKMFWLFGFCNLILFRISNFKISILSLEYC
jgi:hypothetical protein